MKKVILFCGVESTGKSTTIKKIYKYLINKGIKAKIVSEAGREICEKDGGVYEMTLLSYEQILHLHQSNFLKVYASDKYDVILLDTDATYTRYYLEKDDELKNLPFAKDLISLSEKIVRDNIKSKKVTQVIYLNSDCPFVQDGTRTYEQTRKEDDKTLLNLYQKCYKNINVINGNDWQDRTKKVKNIVEDLIM